MSAPTPHPRRDPQGVHGPDADLAQPAALDRLAVPPALTWLRDEAGLRPPAIARVVGVGPAAFARWTTASTADPPPDDVPLLPALAAVYARVCARYPDPAVRRVVGRRPPHGWLSPAEVLRRGKLGEVLRLVADPDGDPDA